MSQRARVAIIAVAAVGLVLAFFAARGSEEADDPPAGGTVTATQPAPSTAPTVGEEGGVAAPPATTTTPAEPQVPTVVVRGGEVRGGVQELDFRQGETVRFRVRSDVADEIHVHGYDLTDQVGPGRTASFSFEADITGRFEVELHNQGKEIASLRVSP